MSPDHNYDNEYTPWIETQETELAYYKRRFLEESAEVERMRTLIHPVFDEGFVAGRSSRSAHESWRNSAALRALDVPETGTVVPNTGTVCPDCVEGIAPKGGNEGSTRYVCPTCGGCGYLPTDTPHTDQTCLACGGTGRKP